MSNIAIAIVSEKSLAVEMILAQSLRDDKHVLEFLKTYNIFAIYLDDELIVEKIIKSGKKSFFKKFFAKFFINSTFFSFPFFILKLVRKKSLAKKLIDFVRPDLIIFPHLGIGGVEDYFNYWSKQDKCNVPTVIIPYAWNPTAEIYTARKNYKLFAVGLFYKIFKFAMKRPWELEGVLFYPFYKILAIELVGSSVKDPWIGDNSADHILLESPRMVNAFLKDKGAIVKTRITGSISQDYVFQYSQEIKEAVEGPYIVFAVPPDQTGNQIPGFEFSNYKDLIVNWVRYVADQKKFKVVLSIHPREQSIQNSLSSIEGVVIFKGDVLSLIPSCSLFICSITGLVRTTAMLKIKTIYYDCFHYNLMEYQDAKIVEYAFSFEHFKKIFSIFIQDHLESKNLQRINSEIDSDWGFFDGKSSKRIMQELRILLQG